MYTFKLLSSALFAVAVAAQYDRRRFSIRHVDGEPDYEAHFSALRNGGYGDERDEHGDG
ncbi:hypothetical protein GRF29_185g1360489 [Pseudopithomyces chartarum]|uniref:Uncharacterized protein n=1 Tax=Pseudopithomyces chartarum TaxID=1892770 RepID=A0AAN6LPQ4_9PLEO|nr:hypothetical protein GRF29_185g1360489 [Pseudopithomyces chartarum]